MAWCVNRATSVVAALALAGAAAFASTRAVAPGPAAGAVDSQAPATLPWWKKSLSHTVQEEWVFAQLMDQQYGPRWRTALPDKVVANLYAAWLRDGGASPD
jgi:hypothetical protein